MRLPDALSIPWRCRRHNYTCRLPARSRKKDARRSGAGLQKSGRRSVGAPVEHGLVGLVLIREIDGLVVAQREVDVAHHLASARALAFDMDRKGSAVALLVQDSAEAEHRIDILGLGFPGRNAAARTAALAN